MNLYVSHDRRRSQDANRTSELFLHSFLTRHLLTAHDGTMQLVQNVRPERWNGGDYYIMGNACSLSEAQKSVPGGGQTQSVVLGTNSASPCVYEVRPSPAIRRRSTARGRLSEDVSLSPGPLIGREGSHSWAVCKTRQTLCFRSTVDGLDQDLCRHLEASHLSR